MGSASRPSVVMSSCVVLTCIVFLHVILGLSGGESTGQDGGVRRAPRRDRRGGSLLPLLPLSFLLDLCSKHEQLAENSTPALSLRLEEESLSDEELLQGLGAGVAKGTHRT